jgi:predicted NAD/FAD-binding protein
MQRVIIIGTGIAGLMAAYLLHKTYDIEVFEANDYIGGHTSTVTVCETDPNTGRPRAIPIDTGFIVCNPIAYPGLMRLFAEIGVPTQQSCMSFSVSDMANGLEYGSRSVNNTFAQRRNLVNPAFWRFILDFARWYREANAAINDPRYANYTLGDFVNEKGYSDVFIRDFLIPATSAVWSTPYKFTFHYPAQSLFRFYHNHGLLGARGIKWRSVVGGSQAYVPRLTQGYRHRIHLNSGAVSVRRLADSVVVKLVDGSECEANHVVLACHSDQALALLDDASPQEREILMNIPYFANEVVLHTDPRFMPRNRRAWESWNYLLYPRTADDDYPVTMTYWMNLLQDLWHLGAQKDYFVTVNPQANIAPEHVIQRFTYHHPQYDFNTVRAQERLTEINGVNRTHFCGAWCCNGFHEDGLQSAVTVAKNLGVEW